MSKRQREWHLLDLDSDPVPADGDDTREAAREFKERGRVMTAAETALKNASSLTGWQGKASEEFVDKAAKAHSDLGKAASKYHDAGDALQTFSWAVGHARAATKSAIDRAEAADRQRRSNTHSDIEGVSSPSPEAVALDDDRRERLRQADSDLEQAKSDLRTAMQDLDDAAKTCASAIKSASENYKDSRMDDIKGAVRSVLKVLVDALNVIALVLAVVIIVLLVIGTGGAILGLLITVAFWMAVAITALTTVQAIMGDASWLDVGLAAVGMVGGGAAKWGGKAAQTALKTARGDQIRQLVNMGRANATAINMTNRGAQPMLPGLQRFVERAVTNQQIRHAVDPLVDSLNAAKVQSRVLRGLDLESFVSNFRQIQVLRSTPAGALFSNQLNYVSLLNNGAGVGSVANLGTQVFQAIGTDALNIDSFHVTSTISTAIDLPGSFTDSIGQSAEGLNSFADWMDENRHMLVMAGR